MTPFWPIDHTADLGLRIRARTKPALLAEAARGLCSLLIEEPAGQPESYREISLAAPDEAYLLADFLAEILSLAVDDGQVVVQVEGLKLAQGEGQSLLKARLGLKPAQSLGGLKQEIKAVTYHGLKIEKVKGGFEATVIFDV